MTTQQHYVGKPGGQKTGQQQMKTEQLKQLPGGEVVKNERIPVPGTGDTPAAAPAQTTAPQAAPAPKPRILKARETAMQPRTARVPGWHYVADHGTTPADLERPEFWAGCTHKLRRRQGDSLTEITVSAEDGSFWGEMVVIDTGPTWAKCRFKYPPLILDQVREKVSVRDHTISFAAGFWRVTRDSDNAILQGDFASAQTALSWLDDHLRAMAA